MTNVANFFKKTRLRTISVYFLVFTVLFGFIGGIAIWLQIPFVHHAAAKGAASTVDWTTVGATHTGLGLALFIVSLLTLVAAIVYGVVSSYVPAMKTWKDTDQAYGVTGIVYVVMFIILITLLSLTLALH